MERVEGFSGGDCVNQQSWVNHKSSRDANFAGKDVKLQQVGGRSYHDDNILGNEKLSKRNMKLHQMWENSKNLQNPKPNKTYWNLYNERENRYQEHFDPLAVPARPYQYYAGFPPNESGDFGMNMNISQNFIDGNVQLPSVQDEVEFERPLPKSRFGNNFLANKHKVNKPDARQLVPTTHELLTDAFIRHKKMHERRSYGKDTNASQFDTLPTNASRVEGHLLEGGHKLPGSFLPKRKLSLHKSLSKFNGIVEDLEREENIDKRDSGTNQSASKDYTDQRVGVALHEELIPSFDGEFQENTTKKDDICQTHEVPEGQLSEVPKCQLSEVPKCQLSEVPIADDKRDLKAVSSLHDYLGRSNPSLKSFCTSASKLTLKSVKKLEDALELERKKCSLINVIDKSISMTKMDKVDSKTNTKANKINEDGLDSIAASGTDCKIQKPVKNQAVNDVLHSDILTNMFKDCRDYHLQNIQQEVKRILFLEELPEKIKRSVN